MRENLESVLEYHERTKHLSNRSARGPGFMDWATQPDPFRRYIGAPLIRLARRDLRESPSYDAIYETDSSKPAELGFESISQFFYDALAISAWKEFQGARWALRVNPSSGNLHPTECHMVCGPVKGLREAPGVYHYAPKEHGLELRAEFDESTWEALMRGAPRDCFLAGVTSIHWREAWKYGERAYRYCQHDAGHALGSMRISAALLGWKLKLLAAPSSQDIGRLFGVDAQTGPEAEHPDWIAAVFPANEPFEEWGPGAEAIGRFEQANWRGEPNRLSPQHARWEIIDEVSRAAEKPRTELAGPADSGDHGEVRGTFSHPQCGSAREIIHRRRSAVDMDGETGISKETFYAMLSRTMPGRNASPFDCFAFPPSVHLLLFVHRVEGLEAGLYMLARAAERSNDLQAKLKPEFGWTSPPACPQHLPLRQLLRTDARDLAGGVSCGQAIAADGAFSLGMIAEFEPRLREIGPWFYPRLFWECGLIGQVLYLEAEAAGIRATGIGCFFDDPVHTVLGVKDRSLQSLYHFTVGAAVDDPRLTTLPAYESG